MACTKTVSRVGVSKIFFLEITTSLVTEQRVLVINGRLLQEAYRYRREKSLVTQRSTSHTKIYHSTKRPPGGGHKKIYNKKCFNRYSLFLKLNTYGYLSDKLCIE